MTALRWARLGPDSVDQWSELTKVLASADQSEEVYEPEDLREQLVEHNFDPQADTWAVWDGPTLVGFSWVAVHLDREGQARCILGGGVHPRWRRRGIGSRLLEESQKRGRAIVAARHPGAKAYYRADGGVEGSAPRWFLLGQGYEVVRYFQLMRRALPGHRLRVDEGLTTPLDEHEEAVRLAHNAAFADHWGSAEAGPERWHDSWAARSSRLDLSTIALDADGRVLSYVLCGQWVPRELYVNLVGTVPAARGRGLAAQCLARTIEVAAASGEYDVVELDVDSESPTGATRIYERLGFEVVKTFATLRKDA